MQRNARRGGFTLIELLVTIAIVAILFVVAAVVINPFQLLQQSRDSRRVSDLATLNGAITLYQSQERGLPGYSLGAASTSYISVADLTASSTAGNACTGIGMPSSTGYAYHCAQSPTDLSTGTGWLPVNFASLPSGAPFKSLPVDPTNQTSSNLYYTYETDGAQWALSAFFESQKYSKYGQATGGIDPALYEIGPGIATLPEAGRGLVAYWPLNEGNGSSSLDWSGNANKSTWNGTPAGAGGIYYAPGKTGQWAGDFDGSTNYLNASVRSFVATTTSYTVSFWSYRTDSSGYRAAIGQNNFPRIQFNGSILYVNTFTPDTPASVSNSSKNVWEFWTIVLSPGSVTFYKNGQYDGATAGTIYFQNSAPSIGVPAGSGANYFQGYMNDVRIYNRALSAAEIQEIYNAEK